MSATASGDSFADFFYPLYERYLSEDDNQLRSTVETKLAEACRDITVEMFLSRAIGYGCISGIVLTFLLMFIPASVIFILGIDIGVLIGIPIPNKMVLHLINALKIPALIFFSGIIGGTIGFTGGFFAPIGNLYLQSGSRAREIGILMPDVLAFMHALSLGGMNQLQVFEAVAKADNTYGEVSQEFAIILQETRYFGVDYKTAIRQRALNTPNSDFGQFLTDMLSILSSGGDITGFLDEQRRKFMRTATKEQEKSLETLELFGEMFMTLSMFPLLLIILLVIMSMIGSSMDMMLFGIVYVLIPMIGIGFIVMISTVKHDDPGNGMLHPEDGDPKVSDEQSALGRGVIEDFDSPYNAMERIREAEGSIRAIEILSNPWTFLKNYPHYTLLLTVPVTVILLGYSVVGGIAPVTWKGMKSNVVWSTFIYIYFPIYIIGIPYALTYEIRERRRRAITKDLSENLRKLASANDTGQTLLEAFSTVSETSSGSLAKEFEVIHTKVKFGTTMKQALIEFNNKYQRPRLARTIKLIAKAQETSSQITDVLSTAAEASEQTDDMDREQKARTRMQIVIIIMTYMTLLIVVIILKTQFLDVMANMASKLGSSGSSGSSAAGGVGGFNAVDSEKLSLLFLHAVTLQGLVAAGISGYLRTGKLQNGLKYAIVLPSLALIAWMFV